VKTYAYLPVIVIFFTAVSYYFALVTVALFGHSNQDNANNLLRVKTIIGENGEQPRKCYGFPFYITFCDK
jgi:hypothetical protein